MARYLIIGGVAGGASAAARLRRNDENAEIVIFERGDYISYASCGLPYYIGGVIKNRENLLVQTPQSFGSRFNIDVRIKTGVLKIDRQRKSVEIQNSATGRIYPEPYDKLILAPGAEAIRPPIPGIDDKAIFTLRNLSDTDRITKFIKNENPKSAVIVGGGFIGLEMAENLQRAGLSVSIVEMLDQILAPFDFEIAAEVQQHLISKGIRLYLKNGVKSFERKSEKISVSLQNGKELRGDIVLLSIGVRPDIRLAKEAGLKIGNSGGISVNEYLATSDPDIYAVGDAIEFINPITGKSMATYLAGPASRQGRIAADNVTGGNVRKYKGAINTAVAKVFDLTVACTGESEKALKKIGIPCSSSITVSFSHAGYYPGAMPITIKTVFANDGGKVLGAQAVGYDGVDKRIDLFASVIKSGGSVYNLQEIEHGYAPPYSSAKDPVNIAGYAASNIIEGKVRVITWRDLQENKELNDIFLLDVRTEEEFSLGTISGAVNIPLSELRSRLNTLPGDRQIAVFCRVGHRGYIASRILLQRGFENVYNLSGGYKTYEIATADHEMEPEPAEVHTAKMKEKEDDKINTLSQTAENTVSIDASGLQCPGPIMKLKNEIDKIGPGARIEILVTDPGFIKDAKSWCNVTGNKLISIEEDKGSIRAIIEKAGKSVNTAPPVAVPSGKTIIVFSDDLDRALAGFVIANGAASMGRKVTMFFTFWGLNVIKKESKTTAGKDLMSRMFGWMMPGSSKALKLSKMNILGLGTIMMRYRMKSKKIDSLEQLMKSAIENGVEIIACQMSMDVMGVTKDDLIDAAEVGGVATYLDRAEQSNVNLFV